MPTEPIGLRPTAPGTSQHPPAGQDAQGCWAPARDPWEGQTLAQAPLIGSAAPGGGLAPGCTLTRRQ